MHNVVLEQVKVTQPRHVRNDAVKPQAATAAVARSTRTGMILAFADSIAYGPDTLLDEKPKFCRSTYLHLRSDLRNSLFDTGLSGLVLYVDAELLISFRL